MSPIVSKSTLSSQWGLATKYFLGLYPALVPRNLWRFPYLVVENGGVAFFIPYLIALVVAALPMFLMEIVLGQFSSLAAISVWNVVPLFKGVGVAMVLISAIVAVYLNVVSAWALFYLINSVSFSLPWSNCANSWSGLSK
ncbi:hypothetical protein Y032_0030g2089 [Ancylostoma ceylanicum]|uniref:Transporter n=1 Tax=Ancylostoma ceylanicum TaxID=53326 RepID=A0A016USQ0_9BILA|nr:hypothetical protein Y032_0030g2089 [Ancylostoma ceylanicum]